MVVGAAEVHGDEGCQGGDEQPGAAGNRREPRRGSPTAGGTQEPSGGPAGDGVSRGSPGRREEPGGEVQGSAQLHG